MNQNGAQRFPAAFLAWLGPILGFSLGLFLDQAANLPFDGSLIPGLRACHYCLAAAIPVAAEVVKVNRFTLLGALVGLTAGLVIAALLQLRPAPAAVLVRRLSNFRQAAGSDTPPISSTAFRWSVRIILGLSLAGLVLRVAARTVALAQGSSPAPSTTVAPTVLVVVPLSTVVGPAPSSTPVPPSATARLAATPSPTATLAINDSAGCAMYGQLSPDLLTSVSKELSLPRDFRPADLAIVPLMPKNQAFQPIPLRRLVHPALLNLLDAMNQAGLSVWVMSGYRSYSDQQLAYDKWQRLYPDRAADISAVPGHSEHQLGTAVDFSTPYMNNLYGDFFNIRFSTTPEGQWLSKQAAYYGFTLSYPAWATQITGYAYEPWHYRYVGSLAQDLVRRNITLTQYIRQCAPH